MAETYHECHPGTSWGIAEHIVGSLSTPRVRPREKKDEVGDEPKARPKDGRIPVEGLDLFGYPEIKVHRVENRL